MNGGVVIQDLACLRRAIRRFVQLGRVRFWLLVRSVSRRAREEHAVGRHRRHLRSFLAHVGAWFTTGHQLTRMLSWTGLVVLWIVLARVTDVAVTGGFVRPEVVLAAPAVVVGSGAETLICEFANMGVDASCYKLVNNAVGSSFIPTIANADSASVGFDCSTYLERVLAGVSFVDERAVMDAVPSCSEPPV